MERTELSTRNTYRAAVNEWIDGIRAEEALALASPTASQEDDWEQAHFKEDDLRNKARLAKKDYEDSIRQNLFNF